MKTQNQKSTTQKGQELETEIINIYRQLGANEVTPNINLHGNQIDLLVTMKFKDGTIHKLVIEAKNWDQNIGVEAVNKFINVVRNLQSIGEIHGGVMVTTSGFTQDAQQAAMAHPLRLITLNDLRAKANNSEAESTITFIQNVFFSHIKVNVTQWLENEIYIGGRAVPQNVINFVSGLLGFFIAFIVGFISALVFIPFLGGEVMPDNLNLATGIALGMGLLGAVLGKSYGRRTWLASIFVFNTLHLGAIVGGTIGGLISLGKIEFSSLMVMGIFTGLIETLLIRPQIIEALEKPIDDSLTREVSKIFINIILGVVVGGFVSYSLYEISEGGGTQFDNAVTGVIFGIIFGVMSSMLIVTFVSALFLNTFVGKLYSQFKK